MGTVSGSVAEASCSERLQQLEKQLVDLQTQKNELSEELDRLDKLSSVPSDDLVSATGAHCSAYCIHHLLIAECRASGSWSAFLPELGSWLKPGLAEASRLHA